MIGKARGFSVADGGGSGRAGSARARRTIRRKPIRWSCRARRAAAPTSWPACWRRRWRRSSACRSIVDNRPDAAAVMGATIVTKAKPDGYTVLCVRQLLLPEPGDPRVAALRHAEGFHRRHHAGAGPVILIVHPDVPAQDPAELSRSRRRRSSPTPRAASAPRPIWSASW
jgi:hypothetical protein